ncbi:MAG: MinD-like ATPase involved in chromosome partitioning or flagellar assembly [Oleispira sp.]|jgi:MinD-like ATPase involved in chromosome partitioning or flagellar assembly
MVTKNNLMPATLDVGAKKPRVIAFTSGKGGVGKTSLSVNLAIALARSGSKVCLFDADMGMANVNIMLGIAPAYTLEHLFTNERTIQDIVLTGPAGLDLVPGASGFSKCVDLDDAQQRRLVDALEYLEPRYDYLIIDTSAGMSSTVLHFVGAAQMAAVVITPEPTSLTDAFSLLKVLSRRGYKRSPQVIVNMVQSTSKAERIYGRFEAAVKKYIGLDTEFLGAVWMDDSIRSSISLQRPVALFAESDPSCKSFYRLADRLDTVFNRGTVPKLSFTTYWKKMVERSNKRRVSAALDNQSMEESPPTASVSEQNKGESVTDELVKAELDNVEPLDSSSEDRWIDIRMKLNQFLQSADTTPEQVTTLLSSCILTYGDRLGGVAGDLIHSLLQIIDPSELSDEDRELMVQNLERLTLVPNASSVVSPAQISVQKHRYNEKEFGSQDGLVEKIRQSSGQMSLDSLLETVKYASLVDTCSDHL